MFLWDVGTGRIIRKFRGHDGVVNSVNSLHPLMLACWDALVLVAFKAACMAMQNFCFVPPPGPDNRA